MTLILHSIWGLLTIAVGWLSFVLGFVLGRDSGRRGAERHAERLALRPGPSHAAPSVRLHMASTARRVYEITDAAGSRVTTRDGS